MKRKILVISLGGTITSKYNPGQGYDSVLSIKDLLEPYEGKYTKVEIDYCDYSQILSFSLTPKMILEVVTFMRTKVDKDGYDGFVVAQGTSALEETSYLADLIWDKEQPVVFTGAMINASEIDSDGPRNLLDSINVAASKEAHGKGVFVSMAGEIHTARDVMKVHKTSINAFKSLNYGEIGFIDQNKAIFKRNVADRKAFPIHEINSKVDVIKVCHGSDARLLDAAISSGAKGVVLEALPGGGGVTPGIMECVKKHKDSDVIFVLAPRSTLGSVTSRASGGCGPWDLFQCGVINGGDLPSPKARILLMVLLSKYGKEKDKIGSVFEVMA